MFGTKITDFLAPEQIFSQQFLSAIITTENQYDVKEVYIRRDFESSIQKIESIIIRNKTFIIFAFFVCK